MKNEGVPQDLEKKLKTLSEFVKTELKKSDLTPVELDRADWNHFGDLNNHQFHKANHDSDDWNKLYTFNTPLSKGIYEFNFTITEINNGDHSGLAFGVFNNGNVDPSLNYIDN